MPINREYSSTGSKLTPATIDDSTLIAMARIVRAFAEIEDLVTLHVCGLVETSESKIRILLGRTAIKRRLEMALYLGKMRNDRTEPIQKGLFNTDFYKALDMRNTLAHGIFLGADEDGAYAFLTERTVAPENNATILVAETFKPSQIQGLAVYAEKQMKLIESNLMLKALRETRRSKALRPHPKGQPRRSNK